MLAFAAFALPTPGAAQSKLYRWVDEKGEVHFSDSIPPHQVDRDRTILNTQGVIVGFEEGEITPAERAEKERLAAQEAARQSARLEVARRDRMLLETYQTVADIADLRDRRLELLESQIKVTELYLANLRKRLTTLQGEASKYKPYATREDAPQVPEYLARDISRTTASIGIYEQTLTRTRNDQEKLRHSFDGDIERFKELKGQDG